MNNAYDSTVQGKKEEEESRYYKIQKAKEIINCCTNGVNNVTNFASTTWAFGLGVEMGCSAAQNYCIAATTSFFGSWRKLT